MNKKGLSEVITTVLIILLVLGAIVLIWTVIRPMIQNSSEQINADALTSSLSIAPNSVIISIDNNVTLKVKRNADPGNITGVNVILETTSGQRKAFKVSGEIKELETKTITILASQHGITETITNVLVSALVNGVNGEEVSSSITSGSKAPPKECNSNWNCTNWSTCVNSLQSRTCTDTNNCTIPTNTQNLTQSCRVPVCGDSIIDSGEQCDRTNLSGQDCSSQTGYKYGSLNCTSTCTLNTTACTPLSTSAKSGLIAYYPLSEGSGSTLNDLSGNGRTATLTEWVGSPPEPSTATLAGNSLWITGSKNRGVQLNGINQSIVTTINLNTSKDFTYMVWAKSNCPERSGIEGCALFHDGEWGARSFETWITGIGTGLLGQFVFPDGVTSTRASCSNCIIPNQWNQIVFVYSSKVLYAYTNGNTTPSIQYPLNITNRESPLKIGRSWGCCGSWYNGSMDEIGIWNRSLTTSEIADLYN